MWTTYILYSPSLDRHYVGQTSDLGSRLRHHASGSTEFTAQTTDWLLVFAEELPDQVHAMRLEQQIKRAKSRASTTRQTYIGLTDDMRGPAQEPQRRRQLPYRK